MNKENILFGIIGLLAGVIIGYIGTNHINRTYTTANTASTGAPTGREAGSVPANHPPASGSEDGQQGDVMAAIDLAKKEPSNFNAQIEAAGLFRQIDRNQEALEYYERAYKIKPKDYNLLVKLADTNFDLEHYEEAERWYQEALKIDAKDPTVRMDLGLTYQLRQNRDLDKAIAEYRKALGYDPRHEKTLQNLTAALIDKGDKTAARETLKQLESVNPSNQALAQFRERLKE
ncbi:MAG: tetratricopeptide repeat protein [Blastocatellia bacterium]|nr:tetratricopeptide repeat protein [Blastocatellia bacterium]